MRNRRDEARVQFEEALRIDPAYAQAHNNLGALLHLLGRTDLAVEHYRRAATLRPDNVEAHANLGQLLSAQGRGAEAAREFRAALSLKPDTALALSGLAWIRATAADAGLRNSDEAVSLAERAIEQTGRRDLGALDALGAAYASAGRFAEAEAAVQSAMDVAIAAGLPAVAAQFGQRRELYRQRRPYRTP
jgi:Flp pilus assembly protein TadD